MHLLQILEPIIVVFVCIVLYCTDIPFKRNVEYYPGYPPVIEITYNVRLQRRPLYYVIYMILPTTIISFMSLLAFLLPSDSGEKIGLGVFILRC